MRAVVQRVSQAQVTAEEQVVGSIGAGLLVLVGIAPTDTPASRQWLVQKLLSLRIFPDETGKMNRNVQETGGGLLVVSQFTLYASTQKGNRPSFTNAAHPTVAEPEVEHLVHDLRAAYPTGRIETGRFGAHMNVQLLNDGPVTLVLDSDHREWF
jgi:D-tyrosyl-tRNA(Tyr) deacylase